MLMFELLEFFIKTYIEYKELNKVERVNNIFSFLSVILSDFGHP